MNKTLKVMTLCAVMLLAGCAQISGDYCQIAAPIWWADQSELEGTPDGIVRQVVRHNEVWESLCK